MIKYKKLSLFIAILVILVSALIAFASDKNVEEGNIISYTVDAKSQDIAFYWKNDSGQIIQSLQNLKTFVEGKNQELVFAANGGMYDSVKYPVGLFIQQYKTLKPLDTSSGSGNFYLKPNGVFYITEDDCPVVCETGNFINNEEIKFATQSGPMLVIDGEVHPAFKEDSKNLNIRNGVGILPNNEVVFAMSETKINFYQFAVYFKSLGCKNALYLDGYVSRTYLPERNWVQTDGNFGVIIGVTRPLTN